MDTQRRMDEERERMRLDGLRRLARIIARHALAHPQFYGDRPGGEPPEAAAAERRTADAGRARGDGPA